MTGQRGRKRPRLTERYMTSTARHVGKRMERARADAEKALAEVDDAVARYEQASAELLAIHATECARLGARLPLDPFVLDCVQQVDVEPGDVWRWRGMRNQQGTPTVRYPRSPEHPHGREGSAVRLLAKALGVIRQDADVHVILHPSSGYDADDVNPAHRTVRDEWRPT